MGVRACVRRACVRVWEFLKLNDFFSGSFEVATHACVRAHTLKALVVQEVIHALTSIHICVRTAQDSDRCCCWSTAQLPPPPSVNSQTVKRNT